MHASVYYIIVYNVYVYYVCVPYVATIVLFSSVLNLFAYSKLDTNAARAIDIKGFLKQLIECL